MQKRTTDLQNRHCGSFFSNFIDELNVFLISLHVNQWLSSALPLISPLFSALSILPANVKKPSGLLLFSWLN
ncbi:TPA: hypothetical protein ACTVBQ_002683 [Klebsiella oxytoca]|uniref:hypothetical protein n=1 Tax=Klebsiella oxytoca TaxID=571 RepID=UPI0011E4DF34|nr:hypothetical protein [Klebsiella oxytoca]HAT3717910.1 hypothetical protein [Klebsiella oxytoca]HBL6843087.1 hypothetical protein [Klebsiella oxytoca]HBM3151233.1 hypothetical protein [Klebsiella oxytoca]HCJ0412005.1 hypothetical protein [Klebsiella oxytoca]